MCNHLQQRGIQVRQATALLLVFALGSWSALWATPAVIEAPADATQSAAMGAAEAAVKQAAADAEGYRNAEHYARQQANDAQREIARSERRMSEAAVEELLAARTELAAKIATVGQLRAGTEEHKQAAASAAVARQ